MICNLLWSLSALGIVTFGSNWPLLTTAASYNTHDVTIAHSITIIWQIVMAKLLIGFAIKDSAKCSWNLGECLALRVYRNNRPDWYNMITKLIHFNVNDFIISVTLSSQIVSSMKHRFIRSLQFSIVNRVYKLVVFIEQKHWGIDIKLRIPPKTNSNVSQVAGHDNCLILFQIKLFWSGPSLALTNKSFIVASMLKVAHDHLFAFCKDLAWRRIFWLMHHPVLIFSVNNVS